MSSDGFRVVSFKVPLIQRQKQLTFRIGETVLEQEGCIKVKKAEDESSNKFFMKLILRQELESLPCSAGVRRRINNDIGTLKLVDHKNIIKLYQVFSSDDVIYVLMEYVTTPLSLKIADRGGRLSEGEALKYFVQLVQAITYLHNRSLAHRNLRIDNIMLDEPTDLIKICDFSTTCLQGSKELLHDHPNVDEAFASPEMLGCDTYHGKKTDMWSLGCILHVLLKGVAPWTSGAVAKDPSTLDLGDISDDCADLLRRMLDIDWKTRINLQDIRGHGWFARNGVVFKDPILDATTVQRATGGKATVESVEASTADEFKNALDEVERGLGLRIDTSSDSPDVVDDSFSPINKDRPRPQFTLLDTPPINELAPPWSGAPGPPEFQLSPHGSPSARTKKLLSVDVLTSGYDAATDMRFDASPMNREGTRTQRLGLLPPSTAETALGP
eukprot:Sspe_Gene.79904::Locus_50228_Transcript_1_1_Confidence_1.000_Length_1829::g.79904::m.79904